MDKRERLPWLRAVFRIHSPKFYRNHGHIFYRFRAYFYLICYHAGIPQSIDQQENPFIQGYRIDTMKPKSRTEVARTICRQYKWCFNNDGQVIKRPNGAITDDTIENIIATMIDMKWVRHSKVNIRGWLPYWDVSPDNPHQAAVQLRQLPDEDGYHRN